MINIPNQHGVTPLHYACYFGNKRAIDLLLDLGADINAKDIEGNTSLHYAINSADLRAIKKLLIRSADKNIRRNDGMTAYDLAIDSNHYEIARVLESRGLFRKYLCMENELTAFRISRNDLFLFTTLLLFLSLKMIYIFKVNSFISDTLEYISFYPGKDTKHHPKNKKISDFVTCFGKKKHIY